MIFNHGHASVNVLEIRLYGRMLENLYWIIIVFGSEEQLERIYWIMDEICYVYTARQCDGT